MNTPFSQHVPGAATVFAIYAFMSAAEVEVSTEGLLNVARSGLQSGGSIQQHRRAAARLHCGHITAHRAELGKEAA